MLFNSLQSPEKRFDCIVAPITSQAEDLISKMKGAKYIECSVRNGSGLEELSLDDLFDAYMKDRQDKYIQRAIELASKTTKKKKKKRFLFF